ncbi:chromosomal replication initiator protein DnaA [uncultured Rhodoblastus sp.]|uniref:chromosomal replication initiator protein DnaA n=1 Tax=uncultured Rhodoblastus sp. TaxID=543037 RepID=UPI0025E79E11|nr:chromosomal replication initiator protein DnaA [uncultured Rhodoblastus sp.]
MSKTQVHRELNTPEQVKIAPEVWARFCARLRTEVGDAVYTSWFTRLELDRIDDGCAVLSVPTKFLKSWIQAHYLEKLRGALIAEIPQAHEIALDLRGTGRIVARGMDRTDSFVSKVGEAGDRAVEPTPDRGGSSKGFVGGFEGSALDRRMNFATFLVGQSNQLAHAAALQASRAPLGAATMFNPLYVYSSVGLGKTHLIQAVAHASAEAGRRVIYLTAEKFMYGFVTALKAQNSIAFKERLRAIDVLVIDDVQFLQGKSIQHEFCHTLNALIDAGRQVVIAGDRMPGDLESLDERVRSRFAGGLCVEMNALDEALRTRILEARIAVAKAAAPGFDVAKAVVAMVARSIPTNGRDLDGAVNRLLAHTTLAGSTLTLEAAEAAIRDLVRIRDPKRVKIEDIQKLVATHFNVSRADILSSRRTANVVRPRQIAMYLSKTMTLRSLPEIGRRFGGRDHTTVLHAVRKIEGLVSTDAALSEELESFKRLLSE